MRIALSLLAALPVLTSSAFGWGCDGHQMIALIARAHLTPAASAAVDQLLRENPIDPALNRFCKDRQTDLMADSATWADDERAVEKATEPWHFINIPLTDRAGSDPEKELMKWCPAASDGSPGCIVTAIEAQWAILRDRNQPAKARAMALRYVIHFLGDMTQPLHVTDNHDRGGNCSSVKFFAEERARNLHGIWDTQLIDRDMEADKETVSQYAAMLDRNSSSHWHEWGESKFDIPGWTWESKKIAEGVSYGDLRPKIPLEPATPGEADKEQCNAERDKVAALHISIDNEYFAQAMPAIREQLTKAGYRLAGLLNQTFP